ncbi:1,5-anhydro-D-fructose reductase [Paraliobacillus sp. PM-2]|uniref:Gfo/Idh/MocA family protein n=1 Tax=Paraliobacillus sp. PM-2 TaxID=1462524 RepID=UPI00061C367A|nr:Gfo/Idh/MocA family oxidoreductase [Paraliobacillus sp. PM-2]CQR46356.1 1,5-anhydro-D-fructose reductase [Paraliobacillus sp. PM-2]
MMKKIKWGILATGDIATAFASDLTYVENGACYAVGSRNLTKAQKFADKFGATHAYGSYEELAADPDVDVIYIATPHPYHKENVLTCLRAGKAVLCEKPFTVNANELEELITYARDKKLFLMEGMWTRFLPAIRKVREWIASHEIGDIRLVKADFGIRAPWLPEWRLLNPELGGGALLDVGIYSVSFTSMILGANPEKIMSTAHLGETGVDEHFSILLTYPEGKTASLNGAIRVGLKNEAIIHGTKGYIQIPSFHNAREASLHVGETVQTFKDNREVLGFRFEAEEVGRLLQNNQKESDIISLDESLAIMKLMDSIREQWGLTYPFEE